jgi:hypothetical protein
MVTPEDDPPRLPLRSDFTSFQGMMLPLFRVNARRIASEIFTERTVVIVTTLPSNRFGEPQMGRFI